MMHTTKPNIVRVAAVATAIFVAAGLSMKSWAQTSSSTASSARTAPIVVQTMPPIPPRGGPWAPDATLQSKLDKAVNAGDFILNPPVGFNKVVRDSPDGSGRVYDWTQPVRANGSQPNLYFVVASAPADQKTKYTAADILENFVDSIRQNRVHWSASTSEIGTVNGQMFARLYYNVVNDAKGFTSHGFIYAAEPSPGKFIIINGEDAEPYADTIFPILEDAALTVRASGSPTPPGVPK